MIELLDSETARLVTSIDDIFESLRDVLEGNLFFLLLHYLRLACMVSNVVLDAEHAHLAPEAIDNLLHTMERRAAAMVNSIESSIARFTRKTAYDLP